MAPIVIDVASAPDVRDVVHRAVQALAEGRTVAFPTETVYGLAASALNERAVSRLLDVKAWAADRPLTLAVNSADDALDYVPHPHILAQRLARRCWPGPVTLVMRDNHPESLLRQLPLTVQQAVSPSGTLGLRVPAHQLILEVLRLLPGPLVLTGANRAGQPESVTGQDVVASLVDQVDLVLDDGRSQFAQPSTVVCVDERGYRVLRAGVVSEDTLRRLSSMLILFVCTGNTCRSPMAEALARMLLADRLECQQEQLEDRGVVVMSAGVAAGAGGGPTPEAIRVMADCGLDLSPHLTQPISDRLVRTADVIYTMTHGHRQAIVQNWPDAASRVAVLCADGADVSDPIGGPRELYRRCADQIKEAIAQRLDQLDLPESGS